MGGRRVEAADCWSGLSARISVWELRLNMIIGDDHIRGVITFIIVRHDESLTLFISGRSFVRRSILKITCRLKQDFRFTFIAGNI